MGRPISFDQTRVLEIIQDQFWKNGYSATSLDDLTKSTGLGKGSLYGAYGSKYDMYLMAFRDYCDWAVKDYQERLRGPDDGALARLQALIKHYAKVSESRCGCMLAKGTAELGGQFPDVDKVIQKSFEALEKELVRCVRKAQRAGDIDPSCDARTLAVTLLAILRGLEALKKAGASPSTLSLLAKGAMNLLQSPTVQAARRSRR